MALIVVVILVHNFEKTVPLDVPHFFFASYIEMFWIEPLTIDTPITFKHRGTSRKSFFRLVQVLHKYVLCFDRSVLDQLAFDCAQNRDYKRTCSAAFSDFPIMRTCLWSRFQRPSHRDTSAISFEHACGHVSNGHLTVTRRQFPSNS